jgi:glycine/D-amino acid oxidase-like deaminating enzyme
MIDYIIVGSGLAGLSFAETCLQNGKSILVFENNTQNSSRIAGGFYNPVILKRFSAVWKAQEQIELLDSFYSKIESRIEAKVDYKLPIIRKFHSVEEQNNWFQSSDKKELAPFLSTKISNKKYIAIDSPFGFGEVLHTGYLDMTTFINGYKKYLNTYSLLKEDSFCYEELKNIDNHIEYRGLKAKNIIFAEGYGMHSNPYFNYLPLDGTKGELFVIKAYRLDLDVIINTSVFILPMGDNLYKVGATYNWNDKTDLPTPEGRQELIDRIKEILNCDFEIVTHLAGVRPTVKDRKPLVGKHPDFNNIYILNGLGTRGVMLGPAMAKALFENIENNVALDKVININRFK